jgi:hypothetical protein
MAKMTQQMEKLWSKKDKASQLHSNCCLKKVMRNTDDDYPHQRLCVWGLSSANPGKGLGWFILPLFCWVWVCGLAGGHSLYPSNADPVF